jgi:hypothetical protein
MNAMTPTPTRREQLEANANTLRRVRWFCIAFAAVMFVIYQGPSDVAVPHPVGPWGVLVCSWLLVTNVVSMRLLRNADVRRMEAVARFEVAADSAIVLFIVALLAFDQVGAEWGLLNIVVLEAALRLRRRDAIICWAATTVAYFAIQAWAEAQYGVENRWTVAIFRMGMVLAVAAVGETISSQLQQHLDAARRAREEADERGCCASRPTPVGAWPPSATPRCSTRSCGPRSSWASTPPTCASSTSRTGSGASSDR